MSDEERWLHEEVKKDEKMGRSEGEKIIHLKGDCTYQFSGGREEAVDLSRIGVYGLCCPHIKDVPDAAVLKMCELQPVSVMTVTGLKGSYAKCGPLAYINHWKKCPFRKD